MTLLQRLFAPRRDAAALRPLYDLVVETGRDPAWYRDGGVPDTLDGRFDMVAAILSLVLLRLEAEGDAARRESVLLTEIFVDDMDASLRQIGIGDFVVGKHIGKMMGALGGRLGAFRSAVDEAASMAAVVSAAPRLATQVTVAPLAGSVTSRLLLSAADVQRPSQ